MKLVDWPHVPAMIRQMSPVKSRGMRCDPVFVFPPKLCRGPACLGTRAGANDYARRRSDEKSRDFAGGFVWDDLKESVDKNSKGRQL